jgi:putative membrane protein
MGVGTMMNWRGDQMWDGLWWWMGFMMLFWVIVLAVFIWAVIRLSRAIESRQGTVDGAQRPVHREAPRETLDRRYAAGEIDSVTYSEVRARLEGD